MENFTYRSRYFKFIDNPQVSKTRTRSSKNSKMKYEYFSFRIGGDETELSDVPSLAGYMQLSDLDWKYKTAPPEDRGYCQAMNGDRCNWPRGKVLGG